MLVSCFRSIQKMVSKKDEDRNCDGKIVQRWIRLETTEDNGGIHGEVLYL